jgi:hypothetical protein
MTSSFAQPGPPAGDARVRDEWLAAASAFDGYLELEGRVHGGQPSGAVFTDSAMPLLLSRYIYIYIYMLRFAALDQSALLLQIPEFVEHLTNGVFLASCPANGLCLCLN